MAKKPNVLKGLLLLLESMSEKEADETLKKIGINPKDYGMDTGKDLIDHWRRCVGALTGDE
jgi:hypothetical protein